MIKAICAEIAAALEGAGLSGDSVAQEILGTFFSANTAPPSNSMLGLIELANTRFGHEHWLPKLTFARLIFFVAMSEPDKAKRQSHLRDSLALPLEALERGAPVGAALSVFDSYCESLGLRPMSLVALEQTLRSGTSTPLTYLVAARARFAHAAELYETHALTARGFYLGAYRCALRALPTALYDGAMAEVLEDIISVGLLRSRKDGPSLVVYFADHPHEGLPQALRMAADELHPRVLAAIAGLETLPRSIRVAGQIDVLRDIARCITEQGIPLAGPYPSAIRHDGVPRVRSQIEWPSLHPYDLDGDGDDELLAGGKGGVGLYRQREGALAQVGHLAFKEVHGVAVADIDADGQSEVLIASS